nr:YadA-like family protein [Photobacterium sanctipauli]
MKKSIIAVSLVSLFSVPVFANEIGNPIEKEPNPSYPIQDDNGNISGGSDRIHDGRFFGATEIKSDGKVDGSIVITDNGHIVIKGADDSVKGRGKIDENGNITDQRGKTIGKVEEKDGNYTLTHEYTGKSVNVSTDGNGRWEVVSPGHPIEKPGIDNPIERPEVDHPIERPPVRNPIDGERALEIQQKVNEARDTVADANDDIYARIGSNTSRMDSLESEFKDFAAQTNQRFDELDEQMDGVRASLHAVTNARPFVTNGEFAVGAGVGFAGSKEALALGGAYGINEQLSVSGTFHYETSGKYSSSEVAGGVGVQYNFK